MWCRLPISAINLTPLQSKNGQNYRSVSVFAEYCEADAEMWELSRALCGVYAAVLCNLEVSRASGACGAPTREKTADAKPNSARREASVQRGLRAEQGQPR